MKSLLFATILIAVAIINSVSAFEYLKAAIYDEYHEKCTEAGQEKCSTVGYCVWTMGKLITALLTFHILILDVCILLVDEYYGSFPACIVDQKKYRRY